jgi:hypothetical protein
MSGRLEALMSAALAETSSDYRVLLDAALAENARGIRDAEAYERYLRGRTTCVTMLAGSGTRWVSSLEKAKSGFDPAKPRGLYPVRDLLGGPNALPIAAYSLAATKGLGRHVIVVRGHEDAIRELAIKPLRLSDDGWEFRTQETPLGKPLGHGDAAWQTMDSWRDGEYVVVNFGGDANSRATVFSALAALDALRSLGVAASLAVPVTRKRDPAYPIAVDAEGLPVSFGHAKLSGAAVGPGEAYTNVGVRVYEARALEAECLKAREFRWKEGVGWDIPGNDPAGHEFALDNVDAELASSRLARLAYVALPEELTPVKTVDDVPAFEAAMERILAAKGS